jgi:peptide/nickel transport system permease protein
MSAAAESAGLFASRRSAGGRAWRRFAASYASWCGIALVGTFVVIAAFADVLAPHGRDQTFSTAVEPGRAGAGVPAVARPPSASNWLGTDSFAKDVLTRVMHGSRLSLLAGVVSIALAISIGSPLGALAGYFGGRLDALLMRSIDVALAFPSVLIALLIAAAFRPGWVAVVIAVGLINVPIFARQIRATVLSVVNLEYVLASRAMGATTWHILLRVILPSLVSPIVVLASLSIGTAILEVAGLSFLGLGGDPTEPEWGNMLGQARAYWHQNIWFALAPGGAISLTVLGFNLLGDGLREALDPRSDVQQVV